MRQFWLVVLCCAVTATVAACHNEAADNAPYYDRKISFADKFFDVRAFDRERAVVVGYAGKVLMTEDGGQSWTVKKTNTNRALYAVDFINTREGWIAGQNGLILHTTDGGETWDEQRSGTILYLFAIDFLDAREGWAVGDKATYFHTVDGGHTWRQFKLAQSESASEEESLLSNDPILYDIQFIDRRTGWIVGEFGKIYHTADGGRTWVEQQGSLLGRDGVLDPLDLPSFFSVHFIDAENGVASGLEGRMARTRDGGETWRFDRFTLEVPLVDPLFRVRQFEDTTGWAIGAAGEVVHKADPRQPWERAQMGMEIHGWMRGMDWVDSDNGWIVGGYGQIFHTTDGGNTWLPCMG